MPPTLRMTRFSASDMTGRRPDVDASSSWTLHHPRRTARNSIAAAARSHQRRHRQPRYGRQLASGSAVAETSVLNSTGWWNSRRVRHDVGGRGTDVDGSGLHHRHYEARRRRPAARTDIASNRHSINQRRRRHGAPFRSPPAPAQSVVSSTAPPRRRRRVICAESDTARSRPCRPVRSPPRRRTASY